MRSREILEHGLRAVEEKRCGRYAHCARALLERVLHPEIDSCEEHQFAFLVLLHDGAKPRNGWNFETVSIELLRKFVASTDGVLNATGGLMLSWSLLCRSCRTRDDSITESLKREANAIPVTIIDLSPKEIEAFWRWYLQFPNFDLLELALLSALMGVLHSEFKVLQSRGFDMPEIGESVRKYIQENQVIAEHSQIRKEFLDWHDTTGKKQMTGRQKVAILFQALSPAVLSPLFTDFFELDEVWALWFEFSELPIIPSRDRQPVIDEFQRLVEVHQQNVAQVIRRDWLSDRAIRMTEEQSRKKKGRNPRLLFVAMPPRVSAAFLNALDLGDAQELANHWSARDLEPQNGASEADIQEIETTYDCSLPEDFKQYLRFVNGMHPDDIDTLLIRFWPVEKIKILPELGTRKQPLSESSTCLVFADFCIDSHFYAIEIEANGESQIVKIGGKAQAIADSFSNFVKIYLSEKRLP